MYAVFHSNFAVYIYCAGALNHVSFLDLFGQIAGVTGAIM